MYTWMSETNLNENEEMLDIMSSQHITKLSTMTQDARLVLVSSFFCEFLLLIVAELELGLTPFTEDPRCKLPFTENSRTYNSMLCVLLRILGPITLCMLSWDLQFHACYLFTEDPRNLTVNKLDNSDKSSNMLQVGQIKHCNQFPWSLLPVVCAF